MDLTNRPFQVFRILTAYKYGYLLLIISVLSESLAFASQKSLFVEAGTNIVFSEIGIGFDYNNHSFIVERGVNLTPTFRHGSGEATWNRIYYRSPVLGYKLNIEVGYATIYYPITRSGSSRDESLFIASRQTEGVEIGMGFHFATPHGFVRIDIVSHLFPISTSFKLESDADKSSNIDRERRQSKIGPSGEAYRGGIIKLGIEVS